MSGGSPAKSNEVFEWRDFDPAYVAPIFPGYVLEREDTREHPERRWQVIGEALGEVFFVVYAEPHSRICRLITTWMAEPPERESWHDITR